VYDRPRVSSEFFTGVVNALAIYAAIGMVMLVVLRWSGVI
jgi:hypothetical protein